MTAPVAVVIVNYRTAALAIACVQALADERSRLPGLSAVVVDGGSGDGSAQMFADALQRSDFAGWTRLLALPVNGGFGWANNQALLSLLQSDEPPVYVHLLNPDAVIEPGAVAALAAELDTHPECAAVGSQLVDPDGRDGGSAFRFPGVGREFMRGAATPALGRLLGIAPMLAREGVAGEADWVTGASVMLRTAALRDVGLFDDGFFLYFEEVELMWRLRRANWTVRHQPASRVRHLGGAATGVNVHRATRRPAYWFASRRRYLALTGGRSAVIGAGLAWLAGHAIGRARAILQPRRARAPIVREGRDNLRLGMWPRTGDLVNHIVDWREPPGAPPAWMADAA